jgi:hypothetical protein
MEIHSQTEIRQECIPFQIMGLAGNVLKEFVFSFIRNQRALIRKYLRLIKSKRITPNLCSSFPYEGKVKFVYLSVNL